MDHPAAETATAAERRTGPGAAVRVTTLGFAAVMLDGAMLNVAVAEIGRSLGGGIGHLQWVVNAYTLAFVSVLVSAGAIADRLGARRCFLSGFAVFGAASLVGALAPDLGALIAATAAQGVGAALLVPSSLAAINHACRGDAAVRVRAVGTWAAAGGVAVAVGPALSGLLVASVGWRSVFLVSAAVAVLGARWAAGALDETGPARSPRGFDWAGHALATLALGALVAAIMAAAPGGWGRGPPPRRCWSRLRPRSASSTRRRGPSTRSLRRA